MLTALLPLLAVQATRAEEICFTETRGPGTRTELVLREDGRYELTILDRDRIDWRDQGSWRAESGTRYRLESDTDASAVVSGSLRVSVDKLRSVDLLPDLRDQIRAFLERSGRKGRFPESEVRDLVAWGGDCPAEDRFVCQGPCEGPWRYFVALSWPGRDSRRKFERGELEGVAVAIDDYLARGDWNVFEFTIASDHGVSRVLWHQAGPGRYEWSREEIAELLPLLDGLDLATEGFPGLMFSVPCRTEAEN